MRTKWILVLVGCAVLLVAGLRGPRCVSAAEGLRLTPPSETIPRTLFGMHIHHLFVPPFTAWPPIPFGTWRLWDAYVVWANVEPQKGKWDFEKLDKYVALAEQHNVQILMPLGAPPPWASERPKEAPAFRPGSAAPPKNMSDWDEYVRTLATRYKGRIRYWELWNEPNLKQFYTGDLKEMVALSKATYAILKQVDPSNELVSPPATSGLSGVSWLDHYLKAGGGKYADIIGFHFYVSPKPPEAMVPLIERVKQVMAQNGVGGKQLWDTETGWYIQDRAGNVKPPGPEWPVLSLKQAGGYVGRAYVLSWASGVSRLNWFAWDNWYMGLVDRDGKTLEAPALAYEQVEKWLVGARMWPVVMGPTGFWVAPITRPGNYRGWIVWRSDKNELFSIPDSWGVREVQELTGASFVAPKNRKVSAGPSPVLLVSPGT